MPAQSINIEIIKYLMEINPKYSKAFALRLTGVHEMIDYFSGVDTIFFAGEGAGGGTLWCFAIECLQW